MNGRTIERMTCEITSRAFIPGRPKAIATAMEGIMAIIRVKSRRMIG